LTPSGSIDSDQEIKNKAKVGVQRKRHKDRIEDRKGQQEGRKAEGCNYTVRVFTSSTELQTTSGPMSHGIAFPNTRTGINV